jgi:hypothetical protein
VEADIHYVSEVGCPPVVNFTTVLTSEISCISNTSQVGNSAQCNIGNKYTKKLVEIISGKLPVVAHSSEIPDQSYCTGYENKRQSFEQLVMPRMQRSV